MDPKHTHARCAKVVCWHQHDINLRATAGGTCGCKDRATAAAAELRADAAEQRAAAARQRIEVAENRAANAESRARTLEQQAVLQPLIQSDNVLKTAGIGGHLADEQQPSHLRALQRQLHAPPAAAHSDELCQGTSNVVRGTDRARKTPSVEAPGVRARKPPSIPQWAPDVEAPGVEGAGCRGTGHQHLSNASVANPKYSRC